MSSAQAGWSAAKQKWNATALDASQEATWDSYTARLFRYAHAEAYYNNHIYTSLVRYSAQHMAASKLYKHTRGVYNPVSRLVDFYVDKVYGGSLDMADLIGGAIPIVTDNDLLRDALRQLWEWSAWRTKKSLYVRMGARRGDVALKVIDDRARQKVRLEVVDPGKIKDVTLDAVGNVKAVVIEYVKEDIDSSGYKTSYTYTETIDQEAFRTFKDGDPFAYFSDLEGQPVAEWPNEYGFVPLVLVNHLDLGNIWGATPFHASLRKIDELNDQASLLNDQVRKSVNPILKAKQLRSGDATLTVSDKDQMPIVYVGDGDLEPLVVNLNIEAVLSNINAMQLEIERDIPELALHRLRAAGGDVTAPGVRAAYSDAIDRTVEARGNYDDGLIRAQKMAVSIGGYNRYDGFELFNLDSYARGDLEHTIAERPVIEEQLTIQEHIQILLSSQAPRRAVWQKLHVPAQDIADWEAEQAQAADEFMLRLDGTPEAEAAL